MSILDPNTVFTSCALFQYLQESAIKISGTKISLFIDTIEANGISANGRGSILDYQNNQNLNIKNVCGYNCTSSSNGLFFYISITNTVNASYISLDSSPPKSNSNSYTIYITPANFTFLNISRIQMGETPGVYLYGAGSKISNITYYNAANLITKGERITESTQGYQTWSHFNGINCSFSTTLYKNYRSTAFIKNVVFSGNWNPSGKNPLLVWRDGGSLSLSNVVIQSNGTLEGPSNGYSKADDPQAIDMVLPDRWFCRALFKEKAVCVESISNRLPISISLLVVY